jgi:hypothetical protein
MSAGSHAQEGVERWRVLDQDGSLTLFVASSDATDNYGSPSFSCRKGSGIVTVGADMDDKQRLALADMISKDEYPKLALVPPDPQFGSLPEIAFSEMSGWYFKFSISADSKAFRDFTRTGAFKFMLGDAVVASSFNVGLENAVKFQNGCRKVPSR